MVEEPEELKVSVKSEPGDRRCASRGRERAESKSFACSTRRAIACAKTSGVPGTRKDEATTETR